MPHFPRAYYWLVLLLIPCVLGLEQCGADRFLTRRESKNSPTEPCLELIDLPTPLPTPSPAPQGTPIVHDGVVVTAPTPEILPTPTPMPSGPVCIATSYGCTISAPFWCPSPLSTCASSCASCGHMFLNTVSCECWSP
jgi:hypothetical protein